jgi:hypothetical protein
MTLAEYLRDKIERGVAFYAERARKIDEGYAAEVEKLARRTRDPVLARFFRETMDPKHIVTGLAHIRMLLRVGKLIEADGAFDRLRDELQFVEAHLQKRYLGIGFRKARGGEGGNALRHADAEDQRRRMRTMFAALRKAGLLKGEAEKQVAGKFKVTTRTVRTAVRGK